MPFVLAGDIAAVCEHHAQRGGVVLVDPQIDFVFGNDFPSDLQRQAQASLA